MVVWSGAGILGALIPFAIYLVVQLGFGEAYTDAHSWPFIAAMAVAAPIVWFLGSWLNSRPGQVVVDKATGKEMTLRKQHRLFWIPMQYWAALWLVLAVVRIFHKF